ncbi:MAG: bacillithiol system redox-active protein YtxJ [Salinimicrobium sp.]
MGLFDKAFKSQRDISKKDIEEFHWNALTEEEQLEQIEEESTQKTVVIFKHSTRCGISRMVLRNFEKDFQKQGDEHKMYYLDLIANRNISNQIAKRFNVAHESPQVIVIKNGDVAHHASHHSIDAAKVESYI